MRSSAVRKATNVSLDSQLLEDARELGINLSRACEEGLARQIKAAREQRWLEENREALASWNEWVKKNGLPLGEYIQF